MQNNLFLAIAVLGFLNISEAKEPTAFFRSPNSRVASGYEDLEVLEKNRITSIHSQSSKVTYQNRTIDVDRQSLIMDTDLIKGKPADDRDIGFAVNLSPTFLRSAGNWKSDVVYHLAEKTLLIPEGILGNWIKVSLASNPRIKGYIEISSVIMKHDFAKYVWQNGTWKPVKYRQNGDLILQDSTSIPIFAVGPILTDPSTAILTEKMKGARVKLQSEDRQLWQVSNLKGHGKVYWLRPKNLSLDKIETLTRQQLLERNIFSYSVSKSLGDLVLVSADGIFLSEDSGNTFRKLDFFNSQNFHVSVSDYGELFVGPYLSNNRGKDFKPWLKIEELMKASKSVRTNPTLQNAMIKDVERLSPSIVKFKLENGIHSYQISGNFRLEKAHDLTIQKARH